jgi:hypothetical protein
MTYVTYWRGYTRRRYPGESPSPCDYGEFAVLVTKFRLIPENNGAGWWTVKLPVGTTGFYLSEADALAAARSIMGAQDWATSERVAMADAQRRAHYANLACPGANESR